ncbi:MAG: divergent PAP2 family protein [Candidatus Gracilibacteria bacterium]|nr:divergent PAP2 family protein [Candidatus Gracilibacteria bacterium]
MHIFSNYIILISAVAWIVAVIIKGIYGLKRGTFSVSQTLGSGGMPSVHSALVTSATTAVGIKYGVFSDLFALALIFSMIIIYDAINVRFEAGLHAQALNSLRKRKDGEEEIYKFNESIGHLPSEAFAGSVIGIIVAMILMNL